MVPAAIFDDLAPATGPTEMGGLASGSVPLTALSREVLQEVEQQWASDSDHRILVEYHDCHT